MTITRGRAVTAAVITVISLGLAACSGDDAADTTTEESSTESSAEVTPEPSEEPTEKASEEATPKETETSQAPTGDDVTADFIARMTAGLDLYTTAAFTMDMTASGQTIASTGQLDYTTDPISMSMTMTGMGAEAISMVTVGGQQYMQMPSVTGDKWIAMEATATDLTTGDPLTAMREFEQGVTSVVLVGEEEAGGVPATHYVVTVDTTKMASTSATPGMPAEITYDIWLDAEGRTVKMSFAFDAAGVPSSTTMTMTDLGAPVSIVAPSADQIMEMPSQG